MRAALSSFVFACALAGLLVACAASAEPETVETEEQGLRDDRVVCARLVRGLEAYAKRRRELFVGAEACRREPEACGATKHYQYDSAIVSRYGHTACGLVAASTGYLADSQDEATPAGSDAGAGERSDAGEPPDAGPDRPKLDRAEMLAWLAEAAGPDYTRTTGIQPTPYARAAKQVFGESAVRARDRVTLVQLYEAVRSGDHVVVDYLSAESDRAVVTATALSSNDGTFAHFSRVLALDVEAGRIYLENSLRPRNEPVVSADLETFCEAWKLPEISADSQPYGVETEPVSRWMLVLDSAARPAPPFAPSCEGLDPRQHCGHQVGGEPRSLYACSRDGVAERVKACPSICEQKEPSAPARCR